MLPVSLGDNWEQPRGLVEPVFFQSLDRWSTIVEGEEEDVSYVSLREAQAQLEALRDDEARVQAGLLSRFNARREVMTMMVETIRERLDRLRMEVVESENADGEVVDIMFRSSFTLPDVRVRQDKHPDPTPFPESTLGPPHTRPRPFPPLSDRRSCSPITFLDPIAGPVKNPSLPCSLSPLVDFALQRNLIPPSSRCEPF